MTDSNSNALLVKLKIGKWTEIRAYLAHEFDALDLNHQIYVPKNFILGHFKERKDGYILSPGGIFYRDSTEDLQQYQRDIDEGKLEVVRALLLPDSELELIASNGKAYVDVRKQIADKIKSVDQYFVVRP